jgi:tRNA dimethylallyltransferase
VSADSVQVYRHFDIGTGKPSAEQRARAPHHLIDCIEPAEPMDAARWAELAHEQIAEIRARGKMPIVCGGSFLFVRSLVHGLVAAPPADAAVRERHRARVEEAGRDALHADLRHVDPEVAARLAPNDFVRVSRALEVFELTGVRMSQWQAEHGFRTLRHRARLVGVRRDPSELDVRIRVRCQAMLDAGWIEEARLLRERGYAGTRPFGAVGYKQIAEALARADVVADSLAASQLLEPIYRATRVFARRQRTWLRDQPVEWLEAGSLKLP